MIPRKVHYCWFGSNRFPKAVKMCLDSWHSNFLGWDFHFWNEDNSPMNHPFVRDAYREGKYAFVSDYVRFWALFNFGGVYLDTDMFVIRPCDDLLSHSCFFGWETRESDTISCGVIGSLAKNPFLSEILDVYDKLGFDKELITQIKVPRIVTTAYNCFEGKEKVTVLPYDYFYPFPYNKRNERADFLNYRTHDTYAIHLWELSWLPWHVKILTSLARTIKHMIQK